MKKNMLAFLLVFSMLLLAIPTTAFARDAWSVKLANEQLINMNTGETHQVKYSLYPEGSTGDVWFESRDPKIASVDEKTGLITALKKGDTYIYFGLMKPDGTRRSRDGYCQVKVKLANPASSFEIPSTLTMVMGTSQQLEVKMVPEGSTPPVTIQYLSTTNKIVIDENGLITAKGIGEGRFEVRMGTIRKYCDITITAPEGYVEPTVAPKWIKEGWYAIRCLYNFVNIAKDGSAELRWTNPAPTYYIKQDEKGTTIKTANGKYLGLSGTLVNGAKIVEQKEPYYWSTQGLEPISIWADSKEKPYMMVSAEGAKNSDGTKLTLWDNKKWTEPLNGDFHLIPAEGPKPQYVKPQTVSPFAKTKPLTLAPSSITSKVKIFGMTLGKTTVAEMKALYGEPDDVWYEKPGKDDRTAWYFYRNNWTDMMVIGAVQPFDKELYKKNQSLQSDMPIESDTCVIEGIYTNKIDLNLGKVQKKVPKDIYAEAFRDPQNNNKQYASFISTYDFYKIHCLSYVSNEGCGQKIGSFEKMYYYTLNGFLATNGKKMLELDELASFNKYTSCAANRATRYVSRGGIDRNTSYEFATLEGQGWEYMPIHAVETKQFRQQLFSGNYKKIAIGYAEGTSADPTSWEPVREVMGCCITELKK